MAKRKFQYFSFIFQYFSIFSSIFVLNKYSKIVDLSLFETRQRLVTTAPPPAKATKQDLSIRVFYKYYVYILTYCCCCGNAQEVKIWLAYSRSHLSVNIAVSRIQTTKAERRNHNYFSSSSKDIFCKDKHFLFVFLCLAILVLTTLQKQKGHSTNSFACCFRCSFCVAPSSFFLNS